MGKTLSAWTIACAVAVASCSSGEAEPDPTTTSRAPTTTEATTTTTAPTTTAAPTTTEAPTTTAAPVGYSEDSPEYKLASLDAGRRLDTDDPIIDAHAGFLDELETKCREPRERIADFAVVGSDIIKDETGQDWLVLDVLIGMNEGIPPEAGQVRCDEVAAAFATLVATG